MEKENALMACLYCGDTMPKPTKETLKKLKTKTLECCDHLMAEIDMNEMYKVVKALDKLKVSIEEEMIKGL